MSQDALCASRTTPTDPGARGGQIHRLAVRAGNRLGRCFVSEVRLVTGYDRERLDADHELQTVNDA